MGAYRYFGLRIGHSWLRGLLLFVRGRNTFLLCTLDVIGFAVCCCLCGGRTPFLFCGLDILCFADFCYSAVAYRHLFLHIENNSLRNLSQLGNQGAPGAHELQETCESQKYPICMNGKRPPVECVNYKKNAKKKNRCAEWCRVFFVFNNLDDIRFFSRHSHPVLRTNMYNRLSGVPAFAYITS